MPQQMTVLAIADQNPDMTRTISQACKAAQDLSARLWVVGFAPEDDDGSFAPRLNGAVSRACEGFDEVTVTPLGTTDIASWVNDQCAAGKVDLIVKTGHRTETLFYSPTDWHLIRGNAVPLLLLAEGGKARDLNTILAAVDLENTAPEQRALDHKVMRIASRLAADFGSTLHGVVCVATSKVLADLDLVDLHKKERARVPQVEEAIASEFTEGGPESANWHIHAGQPDDVIANIASGIKSDLTIVGTVGRKKLKGLLIGNTVEKILKKVRGNLLIIKPDA